MNPAIHHELMHARHDDLMQAAAQHRLAAQVKAAKAETARRARHDDAAAVPRWRVLQRTWRLRPA